MENLWAPWRMDYIKPKRKQSGCLLCRIARDKSHDRKNLVFLRTKAAFCVLNKFPYSNGHIMICPNAHKRHLRQLNKEEILQLSSLVIQTQDLLHKVLRPAGYNIGINLGSHAGAGIDKHLHIHLVPRWRGDTNFMPVISKTKVIPQSLDSLFKKLKKR
ncbi:MAG: HIT domain-containing protein [Candidatus Omnitrophica bacterium]|nr:HIT domain-containing protein [Candidatus Omnitrophota bacterium]